MQCNTTCAAGHDCPYVACGVLTSALGCILSRGLKKASLVETEVQQFHRRAKMQLLAAGAVDRGMAMWQTVLLVH